MATYDLTSTTPTKLAAGDILNCPYSGTVKSITLPKGTYKLEVWGAQGLYTINSPTNTWTYGRGGYAAGTLALNKERTFYIYVGGRPYYSGPNSTAYSAGTSSSYYGGWNGGGARYSGDSYGDNGPGGGATDISITGGDVTFDSTKQQYLRDNSSYLGRIIVAGGGGGGRSGQSYCAGGYHPANGNSSNYAGGMTSSPTSSGSYSGGFGYGATGRSNGDDYGGGGGGWYGGPSKGDSYGGGGSSFVWSDDHASYIPSGYTPTADLKMTSISCIAGNKSMPSSSNIGSTETGHDGNGYCRITVLEIATLNAFVKVGNYKKTVSKILVKVGNTWKTASKIPVKVGGQWKG